MLRAHFINVILTRLLNYESLL